ncbi:MAG: class I SAM-dependent methyltransferase [Acidimicrobiales bacterium]
MARVAPSRKREVPADFDRVAHAYDRLVGANPGYAEHLRLSATRLGLPGNGSGARLVDLCCGTGLSTEALAHAYPEAEIVGLDASPGMLELARARLGDRPRTSFVQGDAARPAEAGLAGSFDGVLIAYGVRNLPDADRGLAAIFDLLSPGAPVCVHEYSVADSARSRILWTAVAWGIIIPAGLLRAGHTRLFRYLWRSVLDFDGVAAFEARLARAGFCDVHTEPVDGWQKDIVHTFCARRP